MVSMGFCWQEAGEKEKKHNDCFDDWQVGWLLVFRGGELALTRGGGGGGCGMEGGGVVFGGSEEIAKDWQTKILNLFSV